ncbi:MAG: hypothetical protein KF773_30990 [Deltaproteobacteria bacterium]|nr:hypothetical protein [Deltaproteobacteria bacterium]MCW5803621.1 hypothetical protein [Deltaproteobacteria bacterium]
MTVTFGQLVSQIFDTYARRFRDEKLAALATQAAIAQLFSHKRARLAHAK